MYKASTTVPEGIFYTRSIKDLKKELKRGELEVGPNGVQNKDKLNFYSMLFKSLKIPKGTFHSVYIEEFQESAPYAKYVGKFEEGETWQEYAADPVTGTAVGLLYTTNDGGKTAEAWCIDPDMVDHDVDMDACHCYSDGRICTDLDGVVRTLAEKRARAVLWISGFVNYLKNGKFEIDE